MTQPSFTTRLSLALALLLLAYGAFVALLGQVCRRFSVVIAIDDIQWADIESFSLLRTMFEDASVARPLIVASRRRGEARDKLAP